MSISLRARFWRFVFRTAFKGRLSSVQQNRASAGQSSSWMERGISGIRIDRFAIDGIRAAWIRSTDAEAERVILHLHGGGYVTGGIDSHRMLCSVMAQTLKMNVLLPEYRLAPEHRFPAALDDALKSYRWLLAQGHAPRNIIISGDSAGAGLCLAAVLSLRDAGDPLPAAVVCLSPWADLTHSGKSHITNADAESVLTTDVLKKWALCYADEAALRDPRISPVFADYRGFPPMFIQAGSEEILLDDAMTVAEKATSANVDVTLKVWDGLWHVWQVTGNLIPETRAAFEEMNEFVQKRVAR
jgi:acetyl esterase/lipase